MTLHTPLCDLLEIQHPIMQAGMGGVAYAELVAAVCEAGGYGVLGMAGRSPDFIREEMHKVRKRPTSRSASTCWPPRPRA